METIIKHNKENKKLLVSDNNTIKTYKLTDAVNKYITDHFPKPEGRIILSKKLYKGDTINTIEIKTLPAPQKETIKQVIKEESTKQEKKQELINIKSKTSEFKFTASFKIARKIPTVEWGNIDVQEFRTVKADTIEELEENFKYEKENAFEELKISEDKLRGK